MASGRMNISFLSEPVSWMNLVAILSDVSPDLGWVPDRTGVVCLEPGFPRRRRSAADGAVGAAAVVVACFVVHRPAIGLSHLAHQVEPDVGVGEPLVDLSWSPGDHLPLEAGEGCGDLDTVADYAADGCLVGDFSGEGVETELVVGDELGEEGGREGGGG